MASIVAKNYSEALFELAQEENKLELMKEELMQIDQVIKAHPELQKVLRHPSIEKKDKKEMLLNIFQEMDIHVSSFIRLLIDKNRFMNFSDIVREFENQYNEANNIQIAYVYSATTLDGDELTRLQAMLETKTKKTIQLVCKIEETLIAGVKVKINDDIYDNSIATKLNKMKEAVIKSAV